MIRFSIALDVAARFIAGLEPSLSKNLIVMRDHFGKIRIAIDGPEDSVRRLAAAFEGLWPQLGVYAQYPGKKILGRDDFLLPDLVFKDNPDIVDYVLPETEIGIRLFERQISGLDWGRITPPSESRAKHVLFYGLKGGVGRSTALAISAYKFSSLGMKVLVLDFDLESPGLSSLLLPPERLPEYGLVDWFVEDAVGQADGLIEKMTQVSSLPSSGMGEIRVAPAYGVDELSYMSKLSRIYGDVPGVDGARRFDERVRSLVRDLERVYDPDLVLIDSRAGLHDIAAIGIMSIADIALLFATDSPQSWEGFRLLFSFWQKTPRVLESVREKLAMVYALFPERNQAERLTSFIEHSYELFSSTLYQEVPAGQVGERLDLFNFDLDSTSSPHYPAVVKWSPSFLDFSGDLLEKGIIDEAMIEICYGAFLKRLNETIGTTP
jgi:cellulose biosynthesis protein BcsQ